MSDRATQRQLRDLEQAVDDLRRLSSPAPWRQPVSAGGGGDDRFLARITGSALQTGHQARWDYAFAEVELIAGSHQLVTGGRTGTAINLLELAHVAEPASGTAWYVWGVQCHSAAGGSYPAGFRPRPVGGGGTTGTHKLNVVVEVTERTLADGTPVYTIEAVGSHDGSCS